MFCRYPLQTLPDGQQSPALAVQKYSGLNAANYALHSPLSYKYKSLLPALWDLSAPLVLGCHNNQAPAPPLGTRLSLPDTEIHCLPPDRNHRARSQLPTAPAAPAASAILCAVLFCLFVPLSSAAIVLRPVFSDALLTHGCWCIADISDKKNN